MKAWLLAACGGLWACGPTPGVLRVQDGAYVLGRAIEPDAYSAYLEGALAESDGKLEQAITAYERAWRSSKHDPELRTRVYSAHCAAGHATTAAAERALHARWLDEAETRSYAPAQAARLQCLGRQTSPDAEAVRRARAGLLATGRDPAVLARLESAPPGDAAGRETLEARLWLLVTAHPEASEAWHALGECLERQGKIALAADAYAELARRRPSLRREMLRKAESLVERQTSAARQLAAAALDAPVLEGAPLGALPDEAVALAVDEALLRGDAVAAERRATRGRMPLGELAARALLHGEAELAETLARSLVEAAGADGADADAVATLLVLGKPAAVNTVQGRPGEAGRQLLERLR